MLSIYLITWNDDNQPVSFYNLDLHKKLLKIAWTLRWWNNIMDHQNHHYSHITAKIWYFSPIFNLGLHWMLGKHHSNSSILLKVSFKVNMGEFRTFRLLSTIEFAIVENPNTLYRTTFYSFWQTGSTSGHDRMFKIFSFNSEYSNWSESMSKLRF